MDISIVTQTLTVLRMTDEERKRYISHPELLALELKRSSGLSVNGHRQGRENEAPKKNGGSDKRVKRVRKPSSKTATKSNGGTFQCKHCHRGFKKAGNRDNHEAICGQDIGTYKPSAD